MKYEFKKVSGRTAYEAEQFFNNGGQKYGLIFQFKGAAGALLKNQIKDVEVSVNIGDIYTAFVTSMDGLKALDQHPQVLKIER